MVEDSDPVNDVNPPARLSWLKHNCPQWCINVHREDSSLEGQAHWGQSLHLPLAHPVPVGKWFNYQGDDNEIISYDLSINLRQPLEEDKPRIFISPGDSPYGFELALDEIPSFSGMIAYLLGLAKPIPQ